MSLFNGAGQLQAAKPDGVVVLSGDGGTAHFESDWWSPWPQGQRAGAEWEFWYRWVACDARERYDLAVCPNLGRIDTPGEQATLEIPVAAPGLKGEELKMVYVVKLLNEPKPYRIEANGILLSAEFVEFRNVTTPIAIFPAAAVERIVAEDQADEDERQAADV